MATPRITRPRKKTGRPTKYKPEYCETVMEYGRNGDTLASLASQLRVSKDTLHEWASVHPEFSEALRTCKASSEAYWLDLAKRRALGTSMGSDFLIKYMLSAAHGLREGTDNTVQADITTKTSHKVEVHFSALPIPE